MIIDFNVFDEAITPVMTLHNPNGEKLGIISESKDLSISPKLTEISDLKFSVPCNEIYKEKIYDKLVNKRIVSVRGFGMFEIVNVSEQSDGVSRWKHIECSSLEVELTRPTISLLEGVYKFYDPVEPEDTIVGEIMRYIPNWKIGSVDGELWNTKRIFDTITESLYGFMMGRLKHTFDCVFLFDTNKRLIHIKKYENITKNTDIIVNYNTLVKNVEINENSDSVVTCLSVHGANDISINAVNPLGTSRIYDYSYYINYRDSDGKSIMSDGLKSALIKWNNKVKSAELTYKALIESIRIRNSELVNLSQELVELNGEHTKLETQYAVRYQQGLDTKEVWTQMNNKKNEVGSKENQIENKKKQLDDLLNQRIAINTSLSPNNAANFSLDQQKELSLFTIEDKYTDEHLLTLDNMSENEKMDVYQELYEKAQGILSEVSQVKYEFSTSLVNYMMLSEYKRFTKQTELGCVIRLELDDGAFAYPILLGYTVNFDKDKRTSVEMEWSNTLRLKNDAKSIKDMLSNAISNGNRVGLDSYKWGEYKKDKGVISEYINGALDCSKQELMNAENQEVVINENGMKLRRWDEDRNDYSPRQAWWINNTLAYTKDNWQSVESAFGEIQLPDGSKTYGFLGGAIVGRIFIGNQLHIQNESNTFRVDTNGVTIRNGNILMTNDDNQEVSIERYISEENSKISSQLGGSIEQVYKDMDTMEQAIKDGEIVIWYQDTKPLIPPAKFGDMWYDTTAVNGVKKNEAWLVVDNGGSLIWEKIKDSEITKALKDAQSAQTTADGKITTYYLPSTTPPQNPSNGDLWFKIDLDNQLWRFNGAFWEDIHDKRIDNLSSGLADAINNIKNIDEYVKDNIIDTFYQATIPNNAKHGDMWLNTLTGKIYRRNRVASSTNWKELWDTITDKVLEDSIKATESIANGKIRSFYQPTEPISTSEYTLGEGDIWFNTANKNELRIYSVSTQRWVLAVYQGVNDETQQAINRKTTTYYDTKPPLSPNEGDLWFDITMVDGKPRNKLARFNGKLWIEITDKNIIDAVDLAQNAKDTADGKIVTYMQPNRPTGASSGDLWIDTSDNNKMHRFDGASWIPCGYNGLTESVANEIKNVMDKIVQVEDIIDGKVDIFYDTKSPENPHQGDIWVDISLNDKNKSKNTMHRYDNGNWVVIQDSSISDIFNELGKLEGAVDGKVTTYYCTFDKLPPVSKLKTGDLWVDIGNHNKLMIRQGMSWFDVSIGGEDLNQDVLTALEKSQQALNKADQALAVADGQIDTYYQESTPNGAKIGDIWINSKSGRVSILTSNGWREAQDQSIKQAIEEANKALGIANGKASIYYADTPPKIGKIGDMWVDTNDSNKMYVHNGSTWVLTMEQAIRDSQTIIKGIYDGYFDFDKQFWSQSYNGENVPSTDIGVIVKEGISGSKAWELQGQQTLYSKNAIPIESNRRLKFIFKVKQTVHAKTAYPLNHYDSTSLSELNGKSLWDFGWYLSNEMQVKAGVVCLDRNYRLVGNPKYFVVNNVTVFPKDGWVTFVGEIEGVGTRVNQYASGAVYIRPTFTVNYPNGDGSILVDSFVIKDITEAHDLDIKYSSELASAMDNIGAEIDKVNGKVDGVVEVYYQPTKPQVAKAGDIWYDTSVGNEAKMFDGSTWKSIKDSDIVKALSNAQSAQTTADGKITTYYRPTAPYDGEVIDGKPILLAKGDLWFNIANANALCVYDPSFPTRWRNAKYEGINDATQDAIDDTNDRVDEVENKVDKVIDPITGDIRTDKLIGSIEAGKNNIDIVSNTTTKAMKLNEAGLLIANSKTSGNWNWKTAISADGIVADAIKSNGTLSGCNILGGTLNIGSGKFLVQSNGNVTASNLTLTGGSINIGSGRFSVDSLGNVKASSIEILGGSLDANTVNIKNLVVGSNVTMGANAKISWSNVDDKPTNLATTNDIPTQSQISSIASTQITSELVASPKIVSPHIKGGLIEGGVIRQVSTHASYTNGEMVGGRLQFHTPLYKYVGALCGSAKDEKLWLQANTALKMEAIEGDISIEPKVKQNAENGRVNGSVWIKGRLVVQGGEIVDEKGNPIGGVAVFG